MKVDAKGQIQQKTSKISSKSHESGCKEVNIAQNVQKSSEKAMKVDVQRGKLQKTSKNLPKKP